MENMEVSNIINNVTESVNSDSDGDDDMENIILKTNPSMLEQLKQSNAAEAFSAAMKTEKGSDGEAMTPLRRRGRINTATDSHMLTIASVLLQLPSLKTARLQLRLDVCCNGVFPCINWVIVDQRVFNHIPPRGTVLKVDL